MAWNRLNSFTIADFNAVVIIAKRYAGSDYTAEMETVLKACYSNQDLSKSIISSSLDDYLSKWVNFYLKDFKNKPSLRFSNPSGTIHDTLR